VANNIIETYFSLINIYVAYFALQVKTQLRNSNFFKCLLKVVKVMDGIAQRDAILLSLIQPKKCYGKIYKHHLPLCLSDYSNYIVAID